MSSAFPMPLLPKKADIIAKRVLADPCDPVAVQGLEP